MATVPCPGCRTDLDPSATVCPICMRPRTKLEITRAYATLREMEKQRKKRPFIIASRLLAAAAIGGVLFRFHITIQSAVSTASATGSKLFSDLLYPPVAKPAAPPPAPIQPPAATAPGPSGPSSAFPGAPAAPARTETPPAPMTAAVAPAKESSPPAHVEDLPLPRFDSTAQWAFYGRVFDLMTLHPVASAQLSFRIASRDNNGPMMPPSYVSGVVATSDPDGRFSVVLPRLADGQSYEIHATRSGYASPVLYESDIPYAKLPTVERRRIVQSAQDGDVTLPPLTDVAGEPSLRRDVFLAPAR